MLRAVLIPLFLFASGTVSALSIPARPGVPEPAGAAKSYPAAPVPSVRIVLPPLSLDEQSAKSIEDSPEKGVYQTGLFRDMPELLGISGGVPSAGSWAMQPDGSQLWTIALESPAALGIRMELGQLALPPGGEVWIFGDDASTPEGPLTEIPLGDPSLWTATSSGETTVLACRVPAEADPSAVTLRIDRIIHQYALPGLLAEKAAGACNLDENCHPDWNTFASAVGGLGVVGANGAIFCTCTLLNDADPCGDTPYVLTANHCVGGQTGSRGASNLEFYWNYETIACNGTAPNPASVARTTGGADYLDGSGGTGFTGGGNDFTLLRMRNEPPASLTRAGWNSDPQSVGTQVTCVHHPRGDFRRITFGALSDTDNTFAALYHEVTWAQGTTEPGSSGSPLLLTASQQIIGQLWGGGASCSALLEPDYYGRFDVTFPQIESMLTQTTAAGFSAAAASAAEGAGSITLSVSLNSSAPPGGFALVATPSPQTALPGIDYAAGAQSFSIPAGASTGTVSIPLLDDPRLEDNRTFIVALAAVNACPDINPVSASIVVTVLDDDPDTDGDGISDADELSGFLGFITDPLLADTDGDGINDAYEQGGTYGYFTDPTDPDTDTDSVWDYTEIFFGTDPTVFDNHGLPTLRVPWLSE
jgi:hypothetical protein